MSTEVTSTYSSEVDLDPAADALDRRNRGCASQQDEDLLARCHPASLEGSGIVAYRLRCRQADRASAEAAIAVHGEDIFRAHVAATGELKYLRSLGVRFRGCHGRAPSAAPTRSRNSRRSRSKSPPTDSDPDESDPARGREPRERECVSLNCDVIFTPTNTRGPAPEHHSKACQKQDERARKEREALAQDCDFAQSDLNAVPARVERLIRNAFHDRSLKPRAIEALSEWREQRLDYMAWCMETDGDGQYPTSPPKHLLAKRRATIAAGSVSA